MQPISRRNLVKLLGATLPAGLISAAYADTATPNATTNTTPPANATTETTAAPANSIDEVKARQLIASTRPCVVLLESETENDILWGTGFFISSDGLLITNHHVVKDTQKLTCIYKNKQKLHATVLRTDPQYDLALVQVDVPGAVPTVTLGDSDAVEPGQLIAVAGYPEPGLMTRIGMSLDSSSSRGSINGVRFGGDSNSILGDTALQIDAPVTHGNSGGPVLRLDTGEVIGVLAVGSPLAGNLTFAVPINPAKVMVSNAGKQVTANPVAFDSKEAIVEPGEIRTLNTISVSKELPTLFGAAFPVSAHSYGTGSADVVVDWRRSNGNVNFVTPLVLDGDDLFFGTIEGKLYQWNTTELKPRPLLDTSDPYKPTAFFYAPAVNKEIICVTSGALDLKSEFKTELSAGGAITAILTGGLFGGAHSSEHVTIDGEGYIFGLNRKNGNIDWEVDTGFVGTPIINSGNVYYGGVGERGCLDAAQGTEKWKKLEKDGDKADWFHMGYAGSLGVYGVAVPIQGRRKSDEAPLNLFGNGKARVERYDPASDKVLWKTEIGDVKDRIRPLSTAMFVDESKGIIYALAVQVVAALDAKTGKAIWTRDQAKIVEDEMKKHKDAKEKSKAFTFGSNMLIHDGIIYVGSNDRKLHALNGADGAELWTYNTRGMVGAPFYHDGQIMFGSTDGYLHVIDAKTGSLVWRHSMSIPALSPPVVKSGLVYAANEAGEIYMVRIPVS